ncbi:MAG: hypothetical protein HY975_00910 [Candidatus Kerfeldbacteria bacterium]|nr:hypothetical protein [Candidatus Kerfeldbacteria bacterium]
MSLSSFLRKLGNRTADQVVGLTSGTTPVPVLDNPHRAWSLIVGVAVVAVGFTGWLTYRTIVSATKVPTPRSNTNAAAIAQLEKLKNVDTDGDTVSDYDELFQYHSSPYLKSSAGDGISDGDKVKNGLDPNCPVGEQCQAFHLVTTATDANGQLTPEFLRQALQAAGVPKTTLDQTDDATLLRIYRQVVLQQPVTTNSNSSTNASTTNTSATNTSTSTTDTLGQFQDLSSSDIRSYLVQSGISQSELDKVDDATLKQIFQEAIQQATSSTTQ